MSESPYDVLSHVQDAGKNKPKGKGSRAKKRASTPPPVAVKHSEKPLAKSKDPEFMHTSVFLKKHTHIEVRKRLLEDPDKRDLSTLVEQLLSQWISK